MNEKKLLIEIIKKYIKDDKSEFQIQNIDEQELYSLAEKNKVSNYLIRWAKENAKNESIKKQIQEDFNLQILKDTNENIECEKILKDFFKELRSK